MFTDIDSLCHNRQELCWVLVSWEVRIIIPIFPMKKLRLREVKSPAWDHTLESGGVEGKQD